MTTISGSRTAPTTSGDVGKMDTGFSHPYPCNTCQVAFRNSDMQKSHMRHDWHRYNLSRRVAKLPPISSETFTEKVLQARAATSAEKDRAGFEKACETCHKTYYSENSFRNHVASAKHRARVAAFAAKSVSAMTEEEVTSMITSTFSLGDPAAASELDSDAEEEFNEVVEGIKKTSLQVNLPPVKRPSNPHFSSAAEEEADQTEGPMPDKGVDAPTRTPADFSSKIPMPECSLRSCLFCNYESPTPRLSAIHMERIHGLFIPEKEYLVDLEGLLAQLQKRILELNECICCGKAKSNAYAVQAHMRDTSHCKIPYSTEAEQLEIGDFYDFRSTYSDGEDDDDLEDEEMEDRGANMGGRRQTTVTREDGKDLVEDDEWETDSAMSSLDSDDLHAVPAESHYHQYERLDKHPHHSRDDQRAHHQRDGWHAHNHKRAHAVFYDNYELHLPSGRSVGHRSLNRYFRQNLHHYPSAKERAERLAIEAANTTNAIYVDRNENSQQGALREGAPVNPELCGLGVTADPNAEAARQLALKGRKKEWQARAKTYEQHSKRHFKEYHRNPVTYLR